MKLKAVIATCILGAAATGAHAFNLLDKGDISVVDCRSHDDAQEAKDRALAETTFALMQKHDMDALDARMPDLKAALGRAPDVAPAPEKCGKTIVIHSDDMSDTLFLSTLVVKGKPFEGYQVVQKPALPYSSLGFIVGWIDYEHQDYNDAITAYRKGLRNNPDDASLVSELTNTLATTGQSEEALHIVDEFLASHGMLDDHDHALMLRRRGYALVELGRLDEGEAAYTESQKYEPDSTVAKSELEYIHSQKAKTSAQ